MKNPMIYAACAILGVAALGAVSLQARRADSPPSVGVAVVELFTSEGCSSCPPADAALATIIKKSAENGASVFALAFHVDYWDRLGWADPYASAANSNRQREYTRKLNLDSIYTPQMIVNGSTEFVGSNRVTADNAIADALAAPASCTLSLKSSATSDGGFTVEISPSKYDPKTTVLNIAVVERNLSTSVKRGENGGRTLNHENVVRWFATKSVSDHKPLMVAVPKLANVKLQNASLIVYAQRTSDWHVLGAAAVNDLSAIR